jgi:hypothetical protein
VGGGLVSWFLGQEGAPFGDDLILVLLDQLAQAAGLGCFIGVKLLRSYDATNFLGWHDCSCVIDMTMVISRFAPQCGQVRTGRPSGPSERKTTPPEL